MSEALRMRILHYVDENNLSWGKSWISLLCALNEEGVENRIVCRPGGTLAKDLSDKGFICRGYKPFLPSLPASAVGFASILGEIKPDIVHTRLSSAARIGGWWGRRRRIPVVSTIDKHAKIKYYNDATLLLPCSKAVAAHMREQGCQAEKLRVIYNAIDLAWHKADIMKRESFRRERSVAPDAKIIVSAGRFDEGKGFENLIGAYDLALKHGEVRGETLLWLLGDGPLRHKIEEQVRELGLGDNVLLPGYVSNVREWFWASDIFVSPSEVPEGFSVALLEAMACGLPAVATDIGGSPEIVSDTVNGRLFSPGKKEELAAALEDLINDRNKLAAYAKEAEKSAGKFGLSAIARETVRIYADILRKRGQAVE